MKDKGMIRNLEKERDLVSDLACRLKQEMGHIVQGDVDSIEEHMPSKMDLIKKIISNRKAMGNISVRPDNGDSASVSRLKQELGVLWTQVSGTNRTSGDLVISRLRDIQAQLEPFFAGQEKGYDRFGRKHMVSDHAIIKGGM
ncbi:MAG: hypothetical protein U9P80_09840 [Thermodesulfobacteriota bacterium]|nr:hypothetical protein [Thermodesulfobacteriota bacterium]